jgi:hypothetical protein
MTVIIVIVHVVIVVLPISGTSVIWRVDIDAVHLTFVRFLKKIERLKVVAFNKKIPGKRSVFAKPTFWICCKNRYFLLQEVIHLFGMLLPDKAVFLVADMILYLVEGLDGGIVGVRLLKALQEGNHLVALYFG